VKRVAKVKEGFRRPKYRATRVLVPEDDNKNNDCPYFTVKKENSGWQSFCRIMAFNFPRLMILIIILVFVVSFLTK
jgi:hypothetical protein